MNKSLLEQDMNVNDAEKMSRLYDKSQKRATKKLIIASIICVIFMIIEIIAAIVSNSLSLMTDASHLFCDLLSFGLNLFSIYVSNFEGNVDMSFGYHRAEIIGALFSIFFIWALSAYILYSAIFRLFNVKVVNGYIMFVTSFVSTLANIFIAYILKVHTHGFGFFDNRKCSHNDGTHNHKDNKTCVSNSKIQSKNKRYKNINSDIALENNDTTMNKNVLNNKINGISCNYVTFDYYENLNKNDNENSHKEKSIGNSLEESKNDIKKGNFENSNENNDNFQVVINDHVNNNDDLIKKKKSKKKKYPHNKSFKNNNIENANAYMLKNENYEENTNCDIYENQIIQQNSCHEHNSEEINNISLKAAYIHAISDLIQNIGVMIASVIIWYNPKYSITDPICSIIFCFIVFSTTISVIKEVLNVLMEGTPVSINLIDLKNDLLKIPGVIDVHDLHVWSLSIGKPALACHIVAHKNNSHNVLNDATLLCQYKYKILHTTVQTDYPSNVSNCETYAHLKCSNLKTNT
ncbi:zinc transporter, putative [Plasmodium gallinaceum]|uniref:Zinc transporter, putative n=1 Tax=Plasmodium gallinaceum TaxID=5849 RepID=A0A1J1H2Q1_PLAGA|nr:zinc transporter, putative [Plasmodium gallinaceum]CRG97630.1 zinc transporter, putative [Plasmodium gallinaceum]